MAIDWARPVTAADGRPARLLSDDLSGPAPFSVAVTQPNGNERVFRVDEDGVSPENPSLNLVNVFLDHAVWVNVYSRDDGGLGIGGKTFPTSQDAANNVRNVKRLVGRNEVLLRAVFDDAV